MLGHGGTRGAATGWRAYVALTKPRIIELLLVTTVPTMVLAAGRWPGWGLVAVTVAGGALAAGGANAINMVIDRDIDRLMVRTQHRPLVTGALDPARAMVFAVLLEVAAFAVLWLGANLLAALLALSATAFYVVVYSLWLKRTSRQNIVIGGAAGAVPALVGWAAVADGLAAAPWILFAVIFFWTPPHFWALAIRHADDYRAASVPMLPAVAPLQRTVRAMVAYTVVVVALTLWLPFVTTGLGWIYGATAVSFGAAFLIATASIARRPTPERAMSVFSFSITYVTALFAAVMVDVLVG
ncbi:MAG: heme o synthase [Acidobacteria bacterium]|nr:heme o synthase [Acidobacteriota bacterium]